MVTIKLIIVPRAVQPVGTFVTPIIIRKLSFRSPRDTTEELIKSFEHAKGKFTQTWLYPDLPTLDHFY